VLTNLNFLNTGEPWAPECETDRLKTYDKNRELFLGEHAKPGGVYDEQFKRLNNGLEQLGRAPVNYIVVLNYFKLTSVRTADLAFSEPPQITVADNDAEGEAKQKAIDYIINKTMLYKRGHTATIDCDRYADTVLSLSSDERGLSVDITPPKFYFAVADPESIIKITHHVFAWQREVDKDRRLYHLHIQIHDVNNPGWVDDRVHALDSLENKQTIGELISRDVLETGFDFCPVFRVSNLETSDSVYGVDSYNDIDSVIAELEVRIAQINRILDKHADPTMAGPRNAIEEDSSGKSYVPIGNYFGLNEGERLPEYITWEARLEANFKLLDILLQQLYTLSEMGSALLGDFSQKTGQVPSGSALRRLMMSPLAKARRIASNFDPVLKNLVCAAASTQNTVIEPEEITIRWNDGLPQDDAEMANIMSVRTGGKSTISQFSAIRRMDGATDEDAQAELDEIRKDDMSTYPLDLAGDINDPATGAIT